MNRYVLAMQNSNNGAKIAVVGCHMKPESLNNVVGTLSGDIAARETRRKAANKQAYDAAAKAAYDMSCILHETRANSFREQLAEA